MDFPPTYITRLLPAVSNCSQLCYYVTAVMYDYFSPWPAVPDLIAPFSTSLLVGDEIALGLILFCTYGSEWKKLVLNICQEDFVRLGAAQTDRLRRWKKVSQVSTGPNKEKAVGCSSKTRRQSRRLAIKVANLSEIVQDLKNKNYVSDTCAELLEQSFSGVPLQLMKRILQKKGQGSFHPFLKAFAITLQFYSTKAYNFVRDTFGLGLPAVSTLRGWFRSVDGNVCFNASVMQSLENKVKEARKQGNEILCSLMLDEMAIMKKIEFDGKKTFGFVDIGSGVTRMALLLPLRHWCLWLCV
ncbi:THAP domain containing 9 [Plakobranchus ocellatus]|uniref:THAP domain containing 9 n=1 Tax=Plakobranchus ocellatus TaxID=259542 RepID=A0AAV4AI69_9GAST|nr:THAP domain containing 9 [Plakobranchus ocellatus]